MYICDINNLKLAKMKTLNFEIGQEVVRIKGDYVVGYTGTIITLDLEKNRAQVDWKETVKTWVSFSAIELTSIPYEITQDKPRIVKGYMKHFHPKYKRK